MLDIVMLDIRNKFSIVSVVGLWNRSLLDRTLWTPHPWWSSKLGWIRP